MKRNAVITHITLWVNRFICLVLAVFVVLLSILLRWYAGSRPLTDSARYALLLAFYPCAIAAALALFRMDRLLSAILQEQIFTLKNVSHIRTIRWCSAAISLICLPASVFYLPLVFMVVIMAFLALVITVLVRVMTAAVEIREENDLTI
jgi:hypothetical protein